MLRLKANYLWPAMWWGCFNSDDPLNPELADEMGIVMGTSHHEPMMNAHDEWKDFGGKKWNYATNAEQLKNFWTNGIKRMGTRESMVTMGMRGDGDVAMSEDTNVQLLEKIIQEQRKILSSVTGKKAEEIPQMWALYKEVQDYYENGMTVADDITLLFCDDNWGNIRQLTNLKEKKRSGGYGIYYHFDYVGGPRCYKWLNTISIPRVWEQMNLAYEYGVDRIWIVNVGDLKPMELPITFFLDYAWNPDNLPANKLPNYSIQWATEQFGIEHAQEIAHILNSYTTFNNRRKPELLTHSTFSIDHYSEFETLVKEYTKIRESADKIYKAIDPSYKDAYYQLVYHPVQACSNLYELYYAHALHLRYFDQQRSLTKARAEEVKRLFKIDAEITDYYHNNLAKGKWDKMMAQTHIGYDNWQEPKKNVLPELKSLTIPTEGQLRLAKEGTGKWWPKEQNTATLKHCDSLNNQMTYIEIYNSGTKPIDFSLSLPDSWVVVSATSGTLTDQKRIMISANWELLKPGTHSSIFKVISPDGNEIKVELKAIKYSDQIHKEARGFVDNRGAISIYAGNFTRSHSIPSFSWLQLPGFPYSPSSVTLMPRIPEVLPLSSDSPHLEYDIYLLEKPKNNKLKVSMILAPTLNFRGGNGFTYAVSVDDEKPQTINMHEGKTIADWKNPKWWNEAMKVNKITSDSTHVVTTRGKHVLKFWHIDSAIVLEKILINVGDPNESYLGPPESLCVK